MHFTYHYLQLTANQKYSIFKLSFFSLGFSMYFEHTVKSLCLSKLNLNKQNPFKLQSNFAHVNSREREWKTSQNFDWFTAYWCVCVTSHICWYLLLDLCFACNRLTHFKLILKYFHPSFLGILFCCAKHKKKEPNRIHELKTLKIWWIKSRTELHTEYM